MNEGWSNKNVNVKGTARLELNGPEHALAVPDVSSKPKKLPAWAEALCLVWG
jgi:hypothetical protein